MSPRGLTDQTDCRALSGPVSHEALLVYNELTVATEHGTAPTEAYVSRFLGKHPHSVWWDVLALVALALVVILVLELTKTTHIFT
jgi:hypothetical protein